MVDLNYHHLRYFWSAVREGSVTGAARNLGVSQPTVSAQIRALEKALGEKLIARRGHSVEATDVGRLVYQYADEIFTIGANLDHALQQRPTDRPLRLVVGVTFGMAKIVVRHLLDPALRKQRRVQLVVHTGKNDQLLASLVTGDFDLVLSDSPETGRALVYTHLLGESDVTILGAPTLAAAYQKRFPACLDGAPFLLPTEGTALRRSLDRWFGRHEIRPRIVAEIADPAVLREFGRTGEGFYAAPTVVEGEIQQIYAVQKIGKAEGVHERYYAISPERKITHPAVAAITATARQDLFT